LAFTHGVVLGGRPFAKIKDLKTRARRHNFLVYIIDISSYRRTLITIIAMLPINYYRLASGVHSLQFNQML